MSTDRMLCVHCFSNAGLHATARKYAVERLEACQNCGRTPASHLDRSALENVFNEFFILGSIPPGAGPSTSLFRTRDEAADDGPTFDNTLQQDYEIISSALGQWLFNYGPPTWRLGITNHDYSVEPPQGDEDVLDSLLTRCETVELSKGTLVYRARLNPQANVLDEQVYDTAPRENLTTFQRFDDADRPLFYCSPEVEACVHECRTTLADLVCVATLEAIAPLRLLDLRGRFNEDPADPWDSFEVLVRRLTTGGPKEYEAARLLAAGIERRGVEGFAYTSFYSVVKSTPLTNYALFGFPVRDGRLRIHSLNRVVLDQVDYKLRFAPIDS